MFSGLLGVCTVVNFSGSTQFNYKEPTKCVTLNNRPSQVRPILVNVNSNETIFYRLTVNVNKCGGSSSTTDDPYARICVPNKVKNMHVNVFNLMSVVNETKFFVQHESCECICRLNESVCNSKQKWSHNKCQCECKELDYWGSCKNDYMWNLSTCDCE